MNVYALAATTATAIMLGGCSTVLDGFGTSTTSAPAEISQITPAPTGSIESAPVPAPTDTIANNATGASAATASAAVTPKTSQATPVALAPPPATAPGGVAYADPGAARTQLAGAWNYGWDNGQKTCSITLSTDRGMNGFAANADVGCPNDIFMTKGWDVWGNEIVLQNHVGKVTARLKPAGEGQFDGVATGDGAKVTLTRS
ncbi:protease inhibitor Inh/omp19 family protein [Ancylobacter pratisalsi]|uniref:AprI/Inh family metalloprotease inhibitor n=1 Tax=Ancylobacter pratisalsi TaxID=1745854 RepID=A0A6P1YIP7_9HYPH|nr:protease inhibitor Inh/omp19 family protein [Ancylobacter pratisalsi]QIB33002.1 AprI/Inh family metalloprotease inhibitor [Ancylobacter pratisalsi]